MHPGYTDADCSLQYCPKNCNGHGSCVDNSRCVCEPGFEGAGCETKQCPMKCSNHGECVLGECHCAPGWTVKDVGNQTALMHVTLAVNACPVHVNANLMGW